MKNTAKVMTLLAGLGTASVVAMVVAGGFGAASSPLSLKASPVEYVLTVDFTGRDYEKDEVLAVTSEEHTIHFGGAYTYYGPGSYYDSQILLYYGSSYWGNVDAISGMSSISFTIEEGSLKVEAGFEEGIFLLDTSSDGGSSFVWDFNGYTPNYFRITNPSSANYLRVSNVEITYSCERSDTPQQLLDEINELGYELNSGGESYSVYPVNSLIQEATIPETYEGKPVTKLKVDRWNSLPSLTKVSVPSSVAALDGYTFSSCANLATVELSEGLQEIGSQVFKNCTSLTRIDIPSTVTHISHGIYSAFNGCTNLNYIGVAECNSLYQSRNGVLYEWQHEDRVYLHTFPQGLILDSYVVPLDTTEIRGYACQGCRIRSITLPNSLRTIGTGAFQDSEIESVTFGNGLTRIESDAFYLCKRITSITLPDSLESIGDRAFSDCTGLTVLNIGEGVTTIQGRALERLTSLTEITVKEGNSSFKAQNGVLFNAAMTELILYPAAKEDASYTVPSTVRTIDDFKNTVNLRNITFLQGLEIIGFECFKGSGITSVSFPSSLYSIGASAFYYCASLTSVDLSATAVSSLPSNLFYYCFALNAVYLPSSLTSIGSSAFYLDYGLEEIHFEGTMEQWNSISKDYGWKNSASSLKTVICADGNVSL